jgi:molybdenum cofactor cytidylyltransferase
MPFLSEMNFRIDNCSAVILAGGNSSRMGKPKAWLTTTSGETFTEQIVSTFKRHGIQSISVVLNEKYAIDQWRENVLRVEKDANVIINREVEKGRLYSLYLALKDEREDYAIIQNVDNPFLDEHTLWALVINLESNGVTIPSYSGQGGHPVIISRKVIEEIVNNWESYKTLKEVFNKFPKKYVDVESDDVLMNINTPGDFVTAMNEFVE